MKIQCIVINELRMWRKHLASKGVECKISTRPPHTQPGWVCVALAFNPSQKLDNYLMVKEIP